MKDFGKILDEWEAQPAAPAKKAPQTPAPSMADIQRHWLDTHPVIDKDRAGKRENSANRRRRLRNMRPQATVDLHLLKQDEAWQELERFFTSARQRGLEKVLIIHGKGNHSKGGEPVLKQMCKHFLEQCEYAGENGHAAKDNGGSGATWVILNR